MVFISACDQQIDSKTALEVEQNTQNQGPQNNKPKYQSKIDIRLPKVGSVIKKGDLLKLEIAITKDQRQIDSMVYFVNQKEIQISENQMTTDDFKSGNNIIEVLAYNSDGSKDRVSTHVLCLLDKAPEIKKLRVVKEYSHDVTAYTQGLIFKDGFLYEGTGQPKESMLKKIDLKKNELIQSYNLPSEVFGEGIACYNNKIYQITWQSKRAFVYDLKTFTLIHEFQYNTEGWGLTNYGEQLIMSDGTQNLYILDPESFSVIDQLQVTDHMGPVTNINEMEWINGKIWANVYLTNTIVIIDPKTGFVDAKMDLTFLVPSTYANPQDNVLNGIAFDAKTGKIYVTGKRWPTLFEVALVD